MGKSSASGPDSTGGKTRQTTLTQEHESKLLNENTVKRYMTTSYLSVDNDDAKFLNVTAQFIFTHLLHKVITHFLDDSEIELDQMYSENTWVVNGRFFFKQLYFEVADAVQASGPVRTTGVVFSRSKRPPQ